MVGAGPAGLLLAIRLADRGRSVVVLDRADGPTSRGGGVVVQPATLRVLDRAGVLDPLLDAGLRLTGLDEAGPDREVFHGDYATLDGCPYPFALAVSQSAVVGILAARAERAGVHLAYGLDLVGLPRVGPRFAVSAAAVGGSAAQTIEAGVVVGADGASSPTRDLAGIPTDVAGFDHRHLVLRAPAPPGWPARMRAYTGDGFVFTVPGPASSVFLFWSRSVDEAAALRASGASAAAAALVSSGPRRLVADLGDGLAAVPAAAPVIEVAYRTVRPATWTRDNLVLLGDSAHAMHSLGGQGMNLALQESDLLAAAVDEALVPTRVEAPMDTGPLERFERRRRPFVESFQLRQRDALVSRGGSLYAGEFATMAMGQPDPADSLPGTAATPEPPPSGLLAGRPR